MAVKRPRGRKSMTCKDAIAVLAEFIEHALSPEALLELEEHLRGCEPCRAYVTTYQKTRRLARKAATAEMPEEMKARLRNFLLSQLGGDPR
jgi:anti-sigma factor (TIGR02949 family)